MKKIIGGLLFLGVMAILGTTAQAATSGRGAKNKTVVNFSATASLACKGKCTVYSVWISTGTDFGVLRDSDTANTSSSPSAYIMGLATEARQLSFDPPLIFNNGVSLNCAATTNFCGVSTERGVSQ